MITYNVTGVEHTQLFNLNKDPYETKNLADNPKFGQKLIEITAILKKEMAFYNDTLDLNKPNWGKK